MQNITRFALIASVAVVGACAPSTDAPVARFGGSFDPGTGALQIVALEGDDVDVEQALLQKVEVDANDGIAGNPDSGTVEVRNDFVGTPTQRRFTGTSATCTAATGLVLPFSLVVTNNVGVTLNPVVIRFDTVSGGVNDFCHSGSFTDVPGLQRPLLASFNYGPAANGADTALDADDGVIAARFVGAAAPFTFTASVFGDF